jgi:hypothetical protein
VGITTDGKCPRLFLARIPKARMTAPPKQVIPIRKAKSGMLDLGQPSADMLVARFNQFERI